MVENSFAIAPTRRSTSFDDTFIDEVKKDFWTCCISREASLLARKEVLTGKAKFGITGDGKEVAQVAMARAFRKGDWRSGYYRDQTFMFALEISTIENYFAQLYADTEHDPFSGGRQMNSHYATPNIDKDGNWIATKDTYNSSADYSSTGGQMARALGLALASKKYRESKELSTSTPFSNEGNEVCFCTIGDASTSEGAFWETMNAAGVLQVPLLVSVWDDGYGISVPVEYQTVKGSISEALAGFHPTAEKPGVEIHTVKGWDYLALRELYDELAEKVRTQHIPVLLHVQDLTQPQGHSTSGSHERYKSQERLRWEREYDCLVKMADWMINSEIATAQEINEIRRKARQYVKEAQEKAWKAIFNPVKNEIKHLYSIYQKLLIGTTSPVRKQTIHDLNRKLKNIVNPVFSDLVRNGRRMYYATMNDSTPAVAELKAWLDKADQLAYDRYHTNLFNETRKAALEVPHIPASYPFTPKQVNGYELLNNFFDIVLERDPTIFAFGEDVGRIGDVNQGFAGLQNKYGEERVFDTGIREWTIMGQAIGMAMRGLRPIAEIQYLDYLIYGLEPLNDDLASLHYRTDGIQIAPAIIRTRGHRLEGIWHAGSPMGMMLNSLQGIYILVPRNMTQAAGFYNTLLQSNDPAIVVECLNGYRLKEELPDNLGEYTVPLGVPEILEEGSDVTLVTYGSCVRIAQQGIKLLQQHGISVELIDVQSLLPFDIHNIIVQSLQKTNRIAFLDEDIPGGATAFMLQQVLEKQNGYHYLDSPPVTITAWAHRPPYGSDGDYFTKPNAENVFEKIYNLIYETEPERLKHKL